MSNDLDVLSTAAPREHIGGFERNLTWWVFACIAVGVLLGQWLPTAFQFIGNLQLAQVNIPVAVLIWLMIVPMLLKIDFGALHEVTQHARGIAGFSARKP